MSHQDYYAETAYDSTKPRELPSRLEGADVPAGQGWWRGRPRLSWGIYFGDFRNENSRDTILRLREKDQQALVRNVSPERMQVPTLANPKAAWATLRNVAGLFLLIVITVDLLAVYIRGVDGYVRFYENHPLTMLWVALPLASFLLGAIAVPFAANRNNIVFNRRTGFVSLPDRGGKVLQLPFDEFDAHLTYEVNPMAAIVFWNLTLMHRSGPRWFNFGDRANKAAYIYQNWELVQQFMDISKPLPDIAFLEPVRHLDPVTADYDRKTGRPPHFWRDRDPEAVQREAEEINTIVSEFFWDSLPRGNDPYGQEASIHAWRSYHPEQAALVDSLKLKGWWPGKEREARVKNP